MARICVFCASSPGIRPAYTNGARSLARALVAGNHSLVYGGGNVGLMGVLADAVLAAGGEVVGVIPHTLMEREVGHTGVTRLHVVDSMHERKALMADLSDAFVALPGGVGTLDETIEVITWRQLGLHDKPIVIVDQDGYWQPLELLMRHVVQKGFAAPALHGLYTIVPDISDVLNTLQAAPPPALPDRPEIT